MAFSVAQDRRPDHQAEPAVNAAETEAACCLKNTMYAEGLFPN